MKVVHAADLHIDSPLAGLDRYESAPVEEIRSATRRALENLVALCVSEKVALLLIAGDLFDGDWRDYSTGLFFSQQMSVLKEAGVEVVAVRGNHDAASQIEKHLRLPDNVFVFSHEQATSRAYEDLGVVVHGQSYRHREEQENLARHYPKRWDSYVNIGLLHTSVSGRPGHATYAPTTLDELLEKGYDYWALGHVHQREVLSEAPWVVFSGNLQGRHVREEGQKGATLITIEEGAVQRVEHRSVDVVRFIRLRVVVDAEASAEAVVDELARAIGDASASAEGRTLVVRAIATGSSAAHARLVFEREHWLQELRALSGEAGSVWVEDLRVETRPLQSAEARAQRGDALGELVRSLARLRTDDPRKTQLLEQFAVFVAKLPHEVKSGPGAVELSSPEQLDAYLNEASELLVERLLEDDG